MVSIIQWGPIFPMRSATPPGMPTCRVTTNCGVPGLVAVAQSTSGSVSNLHALRTGELDSAFVQADILYWAYEGKGFYLQVKNPKKICGCCLAFIVNLSI